MKCGDSGKRNEVYRDSFSAEKLFHLLIRDAAPLMIDVGARTGESAVMFHSIFPGATVNSIEPDPHSFADLSLALPENTTALNLALGASTGTGLSTSTESRISTRYFRSIDRARIPSDTHQRRLCAKSTSNALPCRPGEGLNVDSRRISLVKVDTHGAEADVPSGAQSMLEQVGNRTLELNVFDVYVLHRRTTELT